MRQRLEFTEARATLLERVSPLDTERVSLSRCAGRVLAAPLVAQADIPPFDRAAYDGYAFRSVDSAGASPETPVALRVLEEVPAGRVPTVTVEPGTAVHLFTGAPIPPGADAVCGFESTRRRGDTVELLQA